MRKKTLKSATAILISLFLMGTILPGCNSSTKVYSDTSNQQNSTAQEPSNDQNSSEENSKDQTEKDGQANTDTESGSEAPDQANSGDTAEKPAKERIKARALYLTGWTVGNPEKVQKFVDLAKTTEINSYVIDIKDDDGYVGYESNVPAVRENNAWKRKYNVDKVLEEFKKNDIYVIGRLVCFKDPVLSAKRPDLAVKRSDGSLWKDNHKLSWLSPYNKESWPYIIDIAKEAVAKGFDEIQFDYIRFPNDGDKKAMNFGNSDKKKYEIINEFISYARKELPDVVLSADVFGIICESPADTEDIGQYLELVGMELDYISPMVYPSHYAVGQIVNKVKFAKPDFEPYGVVYNSLAKAKERISKVEGYRANVRPYLQDFTATWLGKGYYQTYGPEQFRQQIQAVYDAGYDEWIFWSAGNKYSEAALLKEDN